MRRGSSTPTRRAIRALALLALTATWWQWARPTALGGEESYVVVDGHSMDGTYHDGDLVVVREEDRYEVGDIIAFRAGGEFEDPTRIIHRIVGHAGSGAFTTKGDNRDRIDPWQPGPDDIIGKAVFHVRGAGQLAASASTPQALAAIGGAAVVVGGRKRRRRRRMILRPDPPGDLPAEPSTVRAPLLRPRPPRWLRRTEPLWAVGGLVACGLLVLPLLGLTWAAMEAADRTTRTDHIGEIGYDVGIDYRFLGEPSPVYPTGTVSIESNGAGALVPEAPLYSRLLHTLEVALTFATRETAADRLSSTYGIDVRLETPGGWSTVLQSVTPTPFDQQTTTALTIDLDDAAARVAQVAQLTGVDGQQYTLTITPTLAVDGAGAGQSVQGQLAPPLSFVVQSGVITAEAVRKVGETTPLVREVDQRARYGLGPVALPTQAARGLLGGLVLVLLGAAGWFASVVFGGVGLGESARIAARYRSQVVDVAVATAPPGPVVMVGGIDELARLAKVDQSVILHEDLGDGAHRYRVFLGQVTYEYESAPEHAGRAASLVDPSPEGPGA
jgi:signal peptidase I